MLEKTIEKKGGDYAKTRDHIEYKFTSPNRMAVPDRLHLAPMPDFMVPIIAQYIRFIEYKAEGKKPTPPQIREHARLRAMGFTVEVVDSVEQSKAITDDMG